MGYIAYRYSRQLKALGLRLELRKSNTDVREIVQELPALLERTRQSRVAIASAMGHGTRETMQKWNDALGEDRTTVDQILKSLPVANTDYSHARPNDLESQLIATHILYGKIVRLRDKYLLELASDDRERAALRDAQRANVRAITESMQPVRRF